MSKSSIVMLFLAVVAFISCQTNSKKEPQTGPQTQLKSDHTKAGAEQKLGPQQVLAKLKEGNRSFVERLGTGEGGHDSSYNYFQQIQHTATQQHPIACVLTCMDSRVPPEIIFDQGIGSLFVIRVAGNIEDPDVLGSMEYAVAEKGVGVVVVMGHKNCGAIGAAFGKVDPENKELFSLVSHVKNDVIAGDKPPYDASAKHNVKKTIDDILNDSKTLRDKLVAGKLIVVGALYDVANGRIDWDTSGW